MVIYVKGAAAFLQQPLCDSYIILLLYNCLFADS